MALRRRGGGGTGGGGGLTLGPATNSFTAATKAAAETLRDDYATANPTWLAQYDAEPTFTIIVSWPATPTNTVYQARRGSAWADVTGLVRGAMGSIGSQGRFDIFCYANGATAPTTPTGGSYVVSTGVLTVPTGTTAAPVEPPANQFSWVSRATINPATQSGSVTPTWSAFTSDVHADLVDRAEAAETGAETAQTAAEAAQTAAETAQTGAETAETGAETAQTAAEAAVAGAETALASSGAALAFNELWTGDLLLSAANQWHALGTEAVPASATWLLWNGGTLTDGTNDGPAALWTWINAADWRALTADTVGTTAGDGTGMLFADWCASDIGDGTPDFTRRDAVIGRTSADVPLLMGPQTGESYFGASLMYITQAVATPGDGASSFSELTGQIAQSQIPDDVITRANLAADARGLDIAAYDSTATYSRGSDNSIVTHANGLFIYISSTERSSGHDPDTQPGYWFQLNEGVAYEVISSGSHRIAARTLVVDGNTDQVYLCTTTQTTPRDLAYIQAQADTIGGTFINLTNLIPTTWKGPHIVGQDYEAGDRVTTNANTRIYTARVDTGETPPHADWIQTGPVGGGGSDLAVQEEGTEVASAATTLNFTGTGATATASDGTVTVDIPGGSLADGAVTTAKLADGSVTTPKLADDAVTGAKIADNTIHGGALVDGTIPTGKIGDAQVTGSKLSSNAVSTGKVADDAITQAKIADDAAGTAQIADDAVTTAKLADNAAGEGKVPIDDTMQFDGSGDLGVNTQRVVQTVSEWVQHFASGSAHDTSGHSGKYHEYTSSNTVRRVGSVQYDFTPGNANDNKTYQVFIVELTGRNIDVILGSSAVYSGNNLQHRFHFADGVTINPNVRIGIGLHRTDGGNNEALSVRFGTESQDSPRESYDDASEDFKFVGRFNHDRPTPTVNDTVGGTTAGQIYGNPEIFYQIIHTHESLVGDGTVSVSHISSGSAADGTVLTADGSGGTAFEAFTESPGSEASDNSVSSSGSLFDETSIDVPTGTWGFVNFGDIGEHFSGEWHRFLVADLTGRTDAADGDSASDTNSLMFVANEEHYLFIGKTSGDKVLVAASDESVNPGNVRIRTN